MKKDMTGLVAAYHAAVFRATGDDPMKLNTRIGAILASEWVAGLDPLPGDRDEFKAAVERAFSGALRFAETAELDFSENYAELSVTGCAFCHGNEVLRNSGDTGICPVSQMVKSSMARSLKTGVELAGVEKPGPVGSCRLRYTLSE